MKNFVQKLRKNNKGFSLVELIIVIAIMAILIAILAPMYFQYVADSRDATLETAANEIATIIKTEMAQGDISSDGALVLDATGTSSTVSIDVSETFTYQENQIEDYDDLTANATLTTLLGGTTVQSASDKTATISWVVATGQVTVSVT